MMIHALRHAAGAERARLEAFLGRARSARSASDIAWVRELMERTGALEHARTVARALAGAALFEFDAYFDGLPASRDIRFMRSLLTWVLQRSH